MKTKPISLLELIDAIHTWSEFWGEPYVLRNDITGHEVWAKHYLEGLNCSKVARKHWDKARTRVFATCDRFPWPCDVIAAARDIDKGVDVEEMQHHAESKAQSPYNRNNQRTSNEEEPPATPEQVDEMVSEFFGGEKNNPSGVGCSETK